MTLIEAVTCDSSETVRIAQDLIRVDTTNFGGGKAVGEQLAAEYIETYLQRLGLTPQLIESAPLRTNLICRVPGRDMDLPPLVVHGHLDVVPALENDWSVDPFAGVIKSDFLWGRGAVDMKNMDAMILSSVSEMITSGNLPARELILAFFADEEAGGVLGSRYMVENHPEAFLGAETAISEVGGYSISLAGKRAYLIQSGEKAMMWLHARAHGGSAHGSLIVRDNALITLAKALVRLDQHEWRLRLTDTTSELMRSIAEAVGEPFDPEHPDKLLVHTGVGAGFIESSLRTSANVTMLDAGHKHNVVPNVAQASIDIRTLPGDEESVLADLQAILGPEIRLEIVHQDIGLEVPFEGKLVEAMVSSLRRADPDARILPYLMPGGTDNKSLARLGIAGFGFVPMQLPADFDFVSMFHGVDERIPITALNFGHRVLTDLLQTY
jgi:acetylornithine deacetylase/succinyl-diaminopimelate desuccinylase-like protein